MEKLKEKIQDLVLSIRASNNPWGDWEKDFIRDLEKKLDSGRLSLSSKQEQKVLELWEKL
jgi:hypothetical protein